MKEAIRFCLQKVVLSVILMVIFLVPAYSAKQTTISAKDDYISCDVQPCVKVAGSEWSEKNPNGVAIAVRMGLKSAATDDQIKMVLTHDLKKHGVKNIKFFYEKNDAPASGIFLHVRGGTEGLFTIVNVRKHLPSIARRALNKNPVFQ